MENKIIYVLDTNVLINDPLALFKFQEHDVYLPSQVIEELDHLKKGHTDISRNARQISRILSELIESSTKNGLLDIQKGIQLVHPHNAKGNASNLGRMHFQTSDNNGVEQKVFGSDKPDNKILGYVNYLKQHKNSNRVILVSKDINIRIKASVSGIEAQDYENDKAVESFDSLFKGYRALDDDFWDNNSNNLTSSSAKDGAGYEFNHGQGEALYPNQYLYTVGDPQLFKVTNIDNGRVQVGSINNYMDQQHSVWGVRARNREQAFALDALMDPNVDFVTLLGIAGTGKTLLTLAAGLAQCVDGDRYGEIIMTRATVNVGEDIGFLPGTEEEKMTPWMGALTDNLEFLSKTSKNWAGGAIDDILANRIKIKSMNFMRGRTFLKRYVIIDEAQNLSPKQIKTLITRAGPGTKIVCLGDVEQIDTPYLTETTSGLSYVVDRFKDWEHSAHITLKRGERSRLADWASNAL